MTLRVLYPRGMGLLIVPSGFPNAPLPPGQSLHQTREAARFASIVENHIDSASRTLQGLDDIAGVDLNPQHGQVKVRDHRVPGALGTRIDGDLQYDPGSGELKNLTARWGAEELRYRESDSRRIWSWDDQGQKRKVTEDRATGTLTVFQG
ncbi:MAG: hypothetical protein HY319_29120 [Armatimonadetes bacterium]|nr:hypothetical protein [Armatimonadota bacterium]